MLKKQNDLCFPKRINLLYFVDLNQVTDRSKGQVTYFGAYVSMLYLKRSKHFPIIARIIVEEVFVTSAFFFFFTTLQSPKN